VLDFSKVTLLIDGVRWDGWKSFELTRQLDALCAEFALGLTDRWTPGMVAMPLAAGMPCEVRLDDSVFLTGYIDKADFSLSAGNHAIQVSGRDKLCDLVDCSAIHKPGQWKNLNFKEIVEILAKPFNIKVMVQNSVDIGPPFPTFKLEEGETPFEAIDRIVKQRELIAIGTETGKLLIFKPGSFRAPAALIQGVNVLETSSSFDMTDRFSDYIVKGQKQGNDQNYGLACAQIRGEARDESVLRYRPMLVRAETQVDTESAIKQAKWEASVRAARAVTVTVKVLNWLAIPDAFWVVGALVAVDLPYLKIKQDLLVTKTTYSLTLDGGTTTTLELKDPKAFDPEPPKKAAGGGSGTKTTAKPKDLQQASADSAWTAHKEAQGG
jgi:prophage tail gpP-like protein